MPVSMLGISVRVVCTVLPVAKICGCFRLLSLISIMEFKSLHRCHSLLLSQPFSENLFGELGQLKILFSLVRDWNAYTFSGYLAMCFILLISSMTGLVIMVDEVPWYMYCIRLLC